MKLARSPGHSGRGQFLLQPRALIGQPGFGGGILGLAVIAIPLLFFLKAAQIHQVFGTSAYDLGIFTQNFWLISTLNEPFNTVRGLHAFGDHFQPVLLLLAPIYRIFPSPLTLFAFQVIAVAWSALIVHRISRQLCVDQRMLALVLAICVLINPVVHNPLLWQYHTLVLALPLYLLWIEAYLNRNDVRFFLLLILLLLVREDVAATTLSFGLIAVCQRRWRLGFGTMVMSVGYWLFVSKVAMPYFNGEGYFRHRDYTVEVLLAHLFDAKYYVQRFWDNGDALRYLAYAFVPFLLLPLRSPLWLLPAVPSLMANILIGGYNTQIAYHYSVYAVPFLFVSTIFSARTLANRAPRLVPWLAAAILLSTIIAALAGSRMKIQNLSTDIDAWKALASQRKLVSIYDQDLGSEIGVAATDFLLPHLANRPQIYLFPNPWRVHYWGIRGESPHHPNRVDYLFLNPNAVWESRHLLRYLQELGYFETEYRDERMWVLKRLKQEPSSRELAIKNAFEYRMPGVEGIKMGQPRLSVILRQPDVESTETGFVPVDGPPPEDWQVHETQDGGGGLLMLDLAALAPGAEYASRYVYLPVTAEQSADVMLLLGSDDTLEVWYQGEKIVEHTTPRPARLGDNRVTIELKRGVNHLYFRVDNLGGAWRLLAELRELPQQDRAMN